MTAPTHERTPAALLVDADAAPIACVPDPVGAVAVDAFRDAAVALALDLDGGPVAGVLFARRWGGGGVALT